MEVFKAIALFSSRDIRVERLRAEKPIKTTHRLVKILFPYNQIQDFLLA